MGRNIKLSVLFATFMVIVALLAGCGGGGGSSDLPMVIDHTPRFASGDVPRDTLVTATFSHDMNPATVNSSSFYLTGPGGRVDATVSYAAKGAVLDPVDPLDYSTTYTATVTRAVKSTGWTPIAEEAVWTFTTADEPDLTPPTVATRSPSPSATGVSVGASVTATFSEPLYSASVNTSTFTLTGPSGAVAGSVSNADSVATFTPAAPLAYSTTYTAALETGITDLAGNHLAERVSWSFTTDDFTGPVVTSNTPAASATGVAVGAPVTATFSEPLDPATVNAANFTLTGPSGAVAGAVSYAGDLATFTPAAPLAYSTTYTATLKMGIADLSGNHPAAEISWSFTTATPDLVRPTVNIWSCDPYSGDTYVSISDPLRVVFSEPMERGSITDGFLTVTGPSGQVSGSLTVANPTTVTFSPAVPLDWLTRYTISVNSTPTDLAGNSLYPTSWYFTTIDHERIAPSIRYWSPYGSPAQNPSYLHVSTTVSATFSEAVDRSSINQSTFTLTGPDGVVSGTYSFSPYWPGASYETVTFTPDHALEPLASFTATVTSGVTDLLGNHLYTPKTWTFSTGDPDTMAPIIGARWPLPNDVEVATTTSIVASYLEPLDPSSVNQSTLILEGPNGRVDGVVACNGATLTFTPSTPLSTATSFTATVSSGVADRSGNISNQASTWSFSTETIDQTPPILVYKSPANKTASVPINTTLKACFDEKLAEDSVSPSSISLTGPQGQIPGTSRLTYPGTCLEFSPAESLAYGTVYSVNIAVLRDQAGNSSPAGTSWTFKTIEADRTGPTVTYQLPENGSVTDTVHPQIHATFSEAVAPDTVNANTFFITGPAGLVADSQIDNYQNKSFYFHPDSDLDYDTEYTVTITTEIKDVNGNNLAAPYTWKFRTLPADPRVISQYPWDGSTQVPIDQYMIIRFSRGLDASSVNTSTFMLFGPQGQIAGRYYVSGGYINFYPASPLEYSTAYSVTLTTGIKASDGTPMAEPCNFNFTTIDRETISPTIDWASPNPNDLDVGSDRYIYINFSEKVLASTINNETFILSGNGSQVDGTFRYGAFSVEGGDYFAFVPSTSLLAGTTYTVTLTTGITDLLGNHLEEPYTYSFATFDPNGPLRFLSIDPVDGALQTAVDSYVVAIFNRPMDPAATDFSTFRITGDSGQVQGTFNFFENKIIFHPSSPLDYSTTYRVELTTGLKGTNGVNLPAEVVTTFTTQSEESTRFRVVRSEPAPAEVDVDPADPVKIFFSHSLQSNLAGGTYNIVGPKGAVWIGRYSCNTLMELNPTLEYNSTYLVTISTGVTDYRGRHLSEPYVFAFTTKSREYIPPRVVSVTPPDDSIVSRFANITTTFSEAILSSSPLSVYGPAGLVSGNTHWQGNTVVFTPSSPLTPGATYEAVVVQGTLDLSYNQMIAPYNWSFTVSADTEPPTLVSSNLYNTPLKPIDFAINITYSEPISQSSINASNIILKNYYTRQAVPCFLYNNGASITIAPISPLEYSTHYSLAISGISDLNGNISGSWSSGFLTEPPPDLAPPTVVETYPAQGAGGVPVGSSLFAWFSETLDPASVSGSAFTLAGPSGGVSGAVAYEGAAVSFTPALPLSPSTAYTATIAGLKDRAGNGMAAAFVFTFTTGATDAEPPSVTLLSPAPDGSGVRVLSQIKARFSEQLDGATLTGGVFTLTGPDGPVAGAVSYADLTATFTPDSPLLCSANYTAALSTGAKDLAGNALGAPVSWTFSTEAPSKTITLVSSDTSGAIGNGGSYYPSTSGNGRYVIFLSRSDNLVPGDLNGNEDTFIKDMVTGETVLASYDSNGDQVSTPFFWSYPPSISDDGRYALLTTAADLDKTTDWPVPPDRYPGVYLRDLLLETTREVDLPYVGTHQPGNYAQGVISGDGKYAAFASDASNLAPGDTNGKMDIFRTDLDTWETELVSVDSGGAQAAYNAWEPTISRDGRMIAYTFYDQNAQAVMVRDMQTGALARVDVSPLGEPSNGWSYDPKLSADGRYLVFWSTASNLVDGDTNNSADVFVRDLQTGTTRRVSVHEDGSQCDFASYEGMASADGRYVFFTSSEPNLAPDYPDSWGGFYMVDTTTGDVTYLYTDSTSNRPARISADGRWVTYYSYTEETEGSHLNGVADVFVIGPLH